ncbi:MAG: hypothetical protein PHD81_02170 [Candidatus Nanoarchaeia archaeon]|nr:hypothetical protein [Candidatus Nanoarchaeia archaeon]MDD5587896.1 hypothetical protein [Candidatus Nanoarchaeia archaeon]
MTEELGLTRLIEIVLVIAVIIVGFLLLTFGYQPLVKAIYNFIDIDTGQNQEQVVSAFTSLQVNYDTCFASQKKECLCNFDIPLFPKDYRIIINKRIISLEKRNKEDLSIWDQLESTQPIKNKFINKNMDCYLNSWNQDEKGTTQDFSYPAIISYIGTASLEIQESPKLITKYSFIQDHPLLYKKDENTICFVIDKPQSGKSILNDEARALITTSGFDRC